LLLDQIQTTRQLLKMSRKTHVWNMVRSHVSAISWLSSSLALLENHVFQSPSVASSGLFYLSYQVIYFWTFLSLYFCTTLISVVTSSKNNADVNWFSGQLCEWTTTIVKTFNQHKPSLIVVYSYHRRTLNYIEEWIFTYLI
jgi:hypothetical protein